MPEAATMSFRKWRIGKAVVTRVIEEGPRRVPLHVMIQATPEMLAKHRWLYPDYITDDGFLLSNSQAFIIESCGKRIMIDPCVGNDKPRAIPFFNMLQTRFLEHLTLAGFPPETIDTVFCTHIHFDHIGWNTRLEGDRWVPTFSNADYLFTREEYLHAQHDSRLEDDPAFDDSVRPVMDAGLGRLVEPDHRITDEIEIFPTPGHTPGHCAVRIRSEGEEAIITGDMIHHPLQACEPDVCSTFCFDEEQARATRKAFLGYCCGGDTIVLGSHFSGPTGVHVRAMDDAWSVVEAKAP